MNPIEYVITALAPHACIICSKEPELLCDYCLRSIIDTKVQLPAVPNVDKVWACVLYEGSVIPLLHQLKFNRAKRASRCIARMLHYSLPDLSLDTVIVPVPTANARVRIRGYDQACLIAKHFAKLRGLRYTDLLVRTSGTRQVGANKQQRAEQMVRAFKAKNTTVQKVLLIDDVLTTGASVSSAAHVLRKTGVQRVYAAVLAYKD